MLSTLKTAFGRALVITQTTSASASASAAVAAQSISARRDLTSARKPRSSNLPTDGFKGLLAALATPSFGTFADAGAERADSNDTLLLDYSDADRGYFGTGSWRF